MKIMDKKNLVGKKNKIPKKLEMSRIKLRKLFCIPSSELDLGEQYTICVIEIIVNVLEDLDYALDEALLLNKRTCKDCIFFMQIKDKGYCRKEYSERKANEPVCYNPLFFN